MTVHCAIKVVVKCVRFTALKNVSNIAVIGDSS